MLKGPGILRRHLEPVVWKIMIWAIKTWVNNFMDQWEKVKFQCDFGHTTYVTISYHDDYPDSFDDLDHPPLTMKPESV